MPEKQRIFGYLQELWLFRPVAGVWTLARCVCVRFPRQIFGDGD